MDRSRRYGARAFALVLILLAGAAPAFAQTGSAVLTGTVVDNVGVVPGATVTATQVDTNVTRTATTNEQGVFRIPSLPPGRYTVKVEMDGFRPINMPAFNLLAGEIRDLGRLDADGRRRVRVGHDHRGSHPGADGDEPAHQEHHGRHAGVGPGQGPRHLRHDEDPAGRRRHDQQPRLRAVELGPRPEHQRRQLAEQEHDD